MDIVGTINLIQGDISSSQLDNTSENTFITPTEKVDFLSFWTILKSSSWLDIAKYLYRYFSDVKIFVDYTKKHLGYSTHHVIKSNIELTSIVQVGTWISRPLELPWIDILIKGGLEHHGLVTKIVDEKITITHFYGSDAKTDCVIEETDFSTFLTNMFDHKFNIYYPNMINDQEFEYYHHMNSLDDIIKIAKSKLGEQGYNLFTNNCEKFVSDCIFKDSPHSFQTNRFAQYFTQVLLDTYLGSKTDHEKVCKRIFDNTFIPFRKFQYKNGSLNELAVPHIKQITI